MAEQNYETTAFNEEIDELRKDVANLKSDLKDLVDVAKKAGIKSSDNTRSRIFNLVSDFNEKVKDGISETYDGAARQGDKAVKVSRETIQERPFGIVAASFLAGILVGRLILK